MAITIQEKKLACAGALVVYDQLPEEKKKLIPSWLPESLKCFTGPEIQALPEEEDPELTRAVSEIIYYFCYDRTEGELNGAVTLRNRNFLVDLLSYKYEEERYEMRKAHRCWLDEDMSSILGSVDINGEDKESGDDSGDNEDSSEDPEQ